MEVALTNKLTWCRQKGWVLNNSSLVSPMPKKRCSAAIEMQYSKVTRILNILPLLKTQFANITINSYQFSSIPVRTW